MSNITCLYYDQDKTRQSFFREVFREGPVQLFCYDSLEQESFQLKEVRPRICLIYGQLLIQVPETAIAHIELLRDYCQFFSLGDFEIKHDVLQYLQGTFLPPYKPLELKAKVLSIAQSQME